MTSDAQLLHATLCFLADRMGADHPDIWVARAVLSATGGQRPTQAGVDALCYVADEQRRFEDLVRADLAVLR
ncbi:MULTISPECIES: hypothetical protein [Mycobacterium]|uniref:hypothetical protein n=1 Tax=Mycobacterium TaxID=1763 RepID=UPI0004D3B6FA|nr:MULTISPECIES: hypothetical protein [Mycobacterium]KEF99960.1 hypothetical protein K883_00006 [Mycobacterium sp. TKK-01-0059]OCB10727.1 hypothetical protein A5644_04285 [Mycobacterium intracellulare subsp. yongonense]